MENVMVRNFKCKCGKARLLTVIDGLPLSKEQKIEQSYLIEKGCDVETITLEDARKKEMCFQCEL